jgi:ABC-type cobalamin/Fe3+-siderophores transport system ATPase subunit
MYPVKMKVGGIRDVSPVIIDWGQEDELVLFGGVNGSGKSTLSFAMAYALGSDQISVETLRSKSLDLSREIWKAHIEIIFQNPPGPSTIDAPEWISLGVEVTQKPNQQAHSTYFSKHGDTIEELNFGNINRARRPEKNLN